MKLLRILFNPTHRIGPLLLFSFFITFCSLTIFAQPIDTLALAKQLNAGGKFKKAENLMNIYALSNKGNLDAQWIYAQTAYWAKHFKQSNLAYEYAISQFHSNYYLKLDYALKLIENGNFKKALPLLDGYRQYDSTSSDLILAYAKIQYWQGYYNQALHTLKLKDSSVSSSSLKHEILSAKSMYLKLNASYFSDDQPLQIINPNVEVGKFIHPLLSPYISLSIPLFQIASNSKYAQILNFGNKLNLIKAGITSTLTAGIIRLPDKSKSWTASVDLTQTSYKYLALNIIASRQPYLVTLPSIINPLHTSHFSFSASWKNLNSWNGKVASSIDKFSSDHNYVYKLSAWLFAPPIKISSFQCYLGYAYGYSSSKENRFSSLYSIDEILLNKMEDNIKGLYNPYFTPTKQSVHSALFSFSFKANKKLSIGSNANLGFLGTTKNPSLFLNKNSGIDTTIQLNYTSINFYPDEISAFFLFKLSPKISIKADYAFLKNNFYTSHKVGLTLKLNFWNEKELR